MQQQTKAPRFVLILILLTALCASLFTPKGEDVQAKPNSAADQVSVVISEFRVRGPNGADDEFIEIYNATGSSFSLLNWRLRKSSGCGATLTDLIIITTPVSLNPGQYYLVAKSGSYSGSVSADMLYTTAGVADDGGIALVDASNNIIDQVGLCSTTTYREGTTLSSMPSSVEQSYEREDGGSAGSCKDTDNNISDFIFNSSSSNPQNFSSPFLPCLVITNVTSSIADGIYTTGAIIDIDVTFSNNVDVTGNPILLLETGATDQNAVYLSGSGSNTLTFRYTVSATDTSADLDYVSTNSLSLNGGSIIGAIGNATLILPRVGQLGSLSFNKNIQIDVTGNPIIISITRQNPPTASTNAVSLTFRVIFNEAVIGVDVGDFVVTGTTATPTSVNIISSSVYDVIVSGGDLAGLNGIVGLNLSATPTIIDINSNSIIIAEPSIDETYTIDNIAPTVTLNQASSQADPTNTQPINFTVVFSEPINTSSFIASDIIHSGTASGVVWNIVNSGDNTTFTLSATASSNGTLIPTINVNRVTDVAGNQNIASTSTDNIVTLSDNISPTVTINQSGSQADPTPTLPINFTVIFSEPINASVFTTSDITQSGTATGITWSIVNSGDNRTFTLSATASSLGTLIPSIVANRVTDIIGNNNIASTSTDNTVTYALIPTSTPTRTPTASSTRSVVINEIAWAGTISSLSDDEWIELYNPSSTAINITGWRISASDGSPNIILTGTIPAGGYFLLEKDDDNTVLDISADQIYTGNSLENAGESLTLYDSANKVIDTANSNGGSWPAGSSSTYGTMERILNTSDSDSAWVTNNGTKKNGKNANNGDILGTPKQSNTAGPTPTPANNRTSTPALPPIDPRAIINEISARPGFDWNQDGKTDVFDEFIEIKNLTAIDITLNGWKLDKNNGEVRFSLPNITLKPNERIVFYSLETNLLLSDGGETVRLINPSGKIYDAYTYTVAKAEDKSFCRLPDGNVYNGWYEDCLPTPNQSNTREGNVPTSPNDSESAVCNLPDTIPNDFFFAECKGYGNNIWNPFYWDDLFRMFIKSNTTKWETFFE